MNAIEPLNSVSRNAIRKREVFPTDESVKNGVAGNPGRVTEMDNAVEGLANGNKSLYSRIW